MLRIDDIHAFGVIGTLQFKPKLKVAKISFYRPFALFQFFPFHVCLLCTDLRDDGLGKNRIESEKIPKIPCGDIDLML